MIICCFFSRTADIYQSENTGDNVMHSEIGRTDDIPYHIVRSGPCHATVSVTSCSPTSGGDSVEDDYHDAIDDDDLATGIVIDSALLR